MLLHSAKPGYDLPAINFVSQSEEAQESHILKEQDARIFTYLEKVLIHMIDEQDAQIFKTWQSVSVICSNAAFLCDILLIVTLLHSF